jgi:hypothetical protein
MKPVVPSLLLMVAIFISSLAASPSASAADQSPPQKFRFVFKSYDGSPAKPEAMSFQLDTLDLRQPTMFLKLGERIPKTQWKLVSFVAKEVTNPQTGDPTDVSELTVRNVESGVSSVLILRRPTIVPHPTE